MFKIYIDVWKTNMARVLLTKRKNPKYPNPKTKQKNEMYIIFFQNSLLEWKAGVKDRKLNI